MPTMPNMLDILLLVAVAVGCNGQGMYSIPTTCDRASCAVYVQWSLMDSDTIQFELEGTADGWVAVGVSADQVMGVDGIDDVFVCQRAILSDTVTAEDAHNPVSPRTNNRDSNQNGFQQISTSYSSGRISCTFTRSILADNLAEDRNLNENVFLLLASGSQRGTSLTQHTLRQAAANQVLLINLSSTITSSPMTSALSPTTTSTSSSMATSTPSPMATIASTSMATSTPSPMATIASTSMATSTPSPMATSTPSPMVAGMYSTPTSCARADCTAYVQWSLVDSDTIQFELEGAADGWVAVGVSADQVMGGDGIDDVFVCQRASGDDTVTAEDAYNPQNQSPRANNRDSNQNGFQQISASYAGGRISCSFTRVIIPDDLVEDRNLNESVYLLLAVGSQRGDTTSVHSTRTPAANQVLLINSSSTSAPIPMATGSFTFPAGCSRPSCTVYAQWMLMDSDTLEFELEGNAAGWVAFGASADAFMGRDGIDDVFVCQRDGATDTVYAQDTYNVEVDRNNIRDTDQTGFNEISTSFTNGRIFCTFTRSLSTGDANQDRDLSRPVFVLLAAGNRRGGPNVTINQHDVARVASAAAVDLTSGQNVVAGCPADPLIRVHGILMYLAWVWLVPTAYFFAANMRPAMPTGKWFQIHRALMVIAIAPSVLGFILIFVAFRNGNPTNGLITLGPENPTGTTHFVFGIIILTLQFLNPMISFLRCKPGSKNRWIFNWIHGYTVGYGVIILALINVGIGIWQYSTLAYGQADNSRYYPFWIWIVFIIVFSFWDTFLFIYSKWIYPYLEKMWQKKEYDFGVGVTLSGDDSQQELEMKPTSTEPEKENKKELEEQLTSKPDEKEDPPKKEPSKDANIRYGFLIFNTCLLVFPGLVIMLLIAIGCI